MLSWCLSLVCALVSFRFSGMEYFVVCLAFVSIYTQKFPAVNVMVSLVCEFLWTLVLEFLWSFSTWMWRKQQDLIL